MCVCVCVCVLIVFDEPESNDWREEEEGRDKKGEVWKGILFITVGIYPFYPFLGFDGVGRGTRQKRGRRVMWQEDRGRGERCEITFV